ncbi:hypothetical protein JL107_08465 [Nakamurella flavida]|uniref:Uncharacterized protein n=1 Tax=Nakamurella flavida TaxID=363630 RepID=A0A938YL02_9ACTN|nr:hypothetical protein [Nakamurella flavida]MBM9476471.1 hypothetical protein [Nakamurella flavida]MDP9779428.1 hypothetical protein [Nakamurella flavida]
MREILARGGNPYEVDSANQAAYNDALAARLRFLPDDFVFGETNESLIDAFEAAERAETTYNHKQRVYAELEEEADNNRVDPEMLDRLNVSDWEKGGLRKKEAGKLPGTEVWFSVADFKDKSMGIVWTNLVLLLGLHLAVPIALPVSVAVNAVRSVKRMTEPQMEVYRTFVRLSQEKGQNPYSCRLKMAELLQALPEESESKNKVLLDEMKQAKILASAGDEWWFQR